MHPIKHFGVITRHRHAVIRNCFRAGIGPQGLFHDLSKYSPTEFWVGAKHFQGTRSPNAAEREARGYSSAWLHHKGRNRHHYEYWRDYSQAEHRNVPVQMPIRYFVEMVCDRIAASKIYRGEKYTDSHPLAYFLNSTDASEMHPKTAAFLRYVLTVLAEQGEDAVFTYLRALDKRQDDYPPFDAPSSQSKGEHS